MRRLAISKLWPLATNLPSLSDCVNVTTVGVHKTTTVDLTNAPSSPGWMRFHEHLSDAACALWLRFVLPHGQPERLPLAAGDWPQGGHKWAQGCGNTILWNPTPRHTHLALPFARISEGMRHTPYQWN